MSGSPLSPKPLDVESARKDASLKVEQTPAFMTAFVALNTQHPPLDDPKVRQAINLAFDRTSYLQAVFEGSASAATGIYPPNTWSYARDIPAYPHAPEQARKLLAGKQLPELNIWTRPSGSLLNPNPSLGAQLLQAIHQHIGRGVGGGQRVVLDHVEALGAGFGAHAQGGSGGGLGE